MGSAVPEYVFDLSSLKEKKKIIPSKKSPCLKLELAVSARVGGVFVLSKELIDVKIT